ncbi:hypothetical protein VCHENC02_5689A, partial [Vibrio harveyi]
MVTAQWFRCGGLRCSPLNAALSHKGEKLKFISKNILNIS